MLKYKHYEKTYCCNYSTQKKQRQHTNQCTGYGKNSRANRYTKETSADTHSRQSGKNDKCRNQQGADEIHSQHNNDRHNDRQKQIAKPCTDATRSGGCFIERHREDPFVEQDKEDDHTHGEQCAKPCVQFGKRQNGSRAEQCRADIA